MSLYFESNIANQLLKGFETKQFFDKSFQDNIEQKYWELDNESDDEWTIQFSKDELDDDNVVLDWNTVHITFPNAKLAKEFASMFKSE